MSDVTKAGSIFIYSVNLLCRAQCSVCMLLWWANMKHNPQKSVWVIDAWVLQLSDIKTPEDQGFKHHQEGFQLHTNFLFVLKYSGIKKCTSAKVESGLTFGLTGVCNLQESLQELLIMQLLPSFFCSFYNSTKQSLLTERAASLKVAAQRTGSFLFVVHLPVIKRIAANNPRLQRLFPHSRFLICCCSLVV